MDAAELRAIATDIPARLDGLSWSRFHRMVGVALRITFGFVFFALCGFASVVARLGVAAERRSLIHVT